MKKFLITLLFILLSSPAWARGRLQGFTENGNTTLTISGAAGTITRKVQGSYPACTVTVYKVGTTDLALIYADDAGNIKANPFTAGSNGSWYFYADNGRYDVRFSGGGISTPFTLGDFSLFDESSLWINAAASPYNAVGDGITVNTTAIQAAIDAAVASDKVLMFPPGTYVHGDLTISTSLRIVGVNPIARYTQTPVGTILKYNGTGGGINIGSAQNVRLENISLDGSAASGSADGIRITGSQNIYLDNVRITDFPRYQVYISSGWDIIMNRVTANNYGRAADNIIQVHTSTFDSAEIAFYDCFLAPATAGKWAYYDDSGTSSLFFSGGTITAPNFSSCNGIRARGQLTLIGTHLEGGGGAGTTGICYTGTNGALIKPTVLGGYDYGVSIGDASSKALAATNAVVGGGIYGATSVKDIIVQDGSSRQGSIILGVAGGTTYQDLRYTTDAQREVHWVGTYPTLVETADHGVAIGASGVVTTIPVNGLYVNGATNLHGTVTLDGQLNGSTVVALPSNGAYYLGATDVDGTWAIVRSGNNLLFMRRESGSYVAKSTITP